jgi:hypothetical protein
LAGGGLLDVGPRRASAPAAENDDEHAHDEHTDPDQQEDDACLVDAETVAVAVTAYRMMAPTTTSTMPSAINPVPAPLFMVFLPRCSRLSPWGGSLSQWSTQHL